MVMRHAIYFLLVYNIYILKYVFQFDNSIIYFIFEYSYS